MKQLGLLSVFVLLSGLGLSARAQVVHSSLNQDPERAKYLPAGHVLRQQANPVALPFFDDFAAYQGLPDPRWWLEEGGAYINNRFGKDPITKHVATFDGLKADGTEYTFFGPTGSRDTLTSQPILMDAAAPQDSVYLSFFWQAGGNSYEFPAAGNSHNLRLEFKDNAGNWNLVWTRIGFGTGTPFTLKMQAITDPKYFHAGFQFRFISSGQKGLKGIWNLDYVLLDRFRQHNNFDRPDLAVSRPLNSLLEQYTAMPYDQYFASPGPELNDSSITTINNLNRNAGTPITWEGILHNLNNSQTNTYLTGSDLIPLEARQYKIFGTPTQTVIQNAGAFLTIENKIVLQTNEVNPATRYNDTITRVTELHNYYAYDDGSPETGFSLARTGTRFGSYRIRLNQPDKVRSIRFYLTGVNNPGTLVTFRIWDDVNGLPDGGNGRYTQNFTVLAGTPLNSWIELPLDSAISVSGTFYVGWGLSASVQQFFNLGYDLNETANANFYIRDNSFTGGNWILYTGPSDLKGAVMLRPVMDNSTITALPEEPLPVVHQIYPNPSAGTIYFSSPWDKITVINMFGSPVAQVLQVQAGQPVLLNQLAKGIYFVRMEQGNTVITKKIILQ